MLPMGVVLLKGTTMEISELFIFCCYPWVLFSRVIVQVA